MKEIRPFSGKVRFGLFEADLQERQLRKSGYRVKLQEQAFQVLTMLLEHPGQVVTREELRQKLWASDTFVDFDHGVNKAVNKIREALGDSSQNPRFIETLPRRGYRFIAPVERVTPDFHPRTEPVSEARNSEISVSHNLTGENAETQQEVRDGQHHLRRIIWFVGVPAVIVVLTATVWLYLLPSDSPVGLPPMKVIRFTSFPGQEKDPALSPDVKQLAFVWDGEKRDNFDIYVQLIGGGKPLQLTSDPRPDVSPVWSPDGSQIAFALVIRRRQRYLLDSGFRRRP
jgi:DNA-binding winged helix-turn-helix (wHTH) protein